MRKNRDNIESEADIGNVYFNENWFRIGNFYFSSEVFIVVLHF